MQVEGRELQSALQYQVLSTGLQHGHLVPGVQHQQRSMLPLEKQVSACGILVYEVHIMEWAFLDIYSEIGLSKCVNHNILHNIIIIIIMLLPKSNCK